MGSETGWTERREIIVADDLHGTSGQRDKPVMVLFHETLMIRLSPPDIIRCILSALVRTVKCPVIQKTVMSAGLLGPQPAIGPVYRNMILLDLKKDQMDEQAAPLTGKSVIDSEDSKSSSRRHRRPKGRARTGIS